MYIILGCSKLLVIFLPQRSLKTQNREVQKYIVIMAQLSSLSLPSPISKTKDAPKPQPSGATRGHIASINRRGSSLLQRFVVHNQPHNTSLHKKYRWCMHTHHRPYAAHTPPNRLMWCFLPRIWTVEAGGGGYLCRYAAIRALWAVVATSVFI